jgi:hypothetical protein
MGVEFNITIVEKKSGVKNEHTQAHCQADLTTYTVFLRDR